MASTIGVVKSFENGTFYVRDTKGDVHQLKAGETISEGDHVYGAYGNTPDAKIVIDVLLAGAGDLVLAGDGALQFESALLATMYSHNEAVIHINSLMEGLAITAAAEVQMQSAAEEKTAGTEAGDETAAGTAVTDTERLADTFAARDGLITDVATNVNLTSPSILQAAASETPVYLVTEETPIPNSLADGGELVTINEDTNATGNVLLNVVDPDVGDVHSVTQFVVNGVVYPAGTTVDIQDIGSLVIQENGDFIFTPLPDYNGPVPVATYTVTDGTDTIDSTLNITVTPVNDAPSVDVVAYQSFTEGEAHEGDIAFTYTGSDPDTPSDQLVYSLTNNSNGYLELGPNNTIVLTQAGADAINADIPISTLMATVQVSDGALTAADSDITSVAAVNDSVTIEATPPEAVFESGLESGTFPSMGDITTSGSFTVGDPDGLQDVKSITIAGIVLTVSTSGLEGLVGSEIPTPYGMITLTDYSNGTFDYDYVLNAAVNNDSAANSYDYSFNVSVSDGITSDSVPVSITIMDDAPLLGSIQNAIVANAIGQVTGTINVEYGADGDIPPAKLAISGYDQYDGLNYNLSNDGQTLTATTESGDVFYTLNLNPNGTYTVDYTERPIINYPIDFSNYDPNGAAVENIVATAGNYNVIFNGAVYDGSQLIDLGSASNTDDLKPTGVGFGVEGPGIDNNDGFIATFVDASNPLGVSNFAFEISEQGNAPGVNVHWAAYDGSTMVGSDMDGEWVPIPQHGNAEFNINLSDVSGAFDKVEIWFDGLDRNDDVRIESFTVGTSVIPQDQPLNFDVTAYDSDGDISDTSSFSVMLQGGVGPDYTLIGTDNDEVLVGGTGADSLYGESGDDTLVYDSHDVTIDGGTGTDTLILTGSSNIDFHTLASNSSNIEVIDLSNGDHDLTSITFTDVMNMTESGNSNIYILGDGADQVGFLNSGDWNQTGTAVSYDIKGTTYTFDEYTSADDPTVMVRVEAEIPVI